MDGLPVVIQSLQDGLPLFVVHLAVSLAILTISIIIYDYLTITPYMKLIKEGNISAAISLGGAVISLALPLAFCLSGSVSIWDIVVWSIPIVILQIAIFFIFNFIVGDLPGRIARGEVAVALFVVMVRLSTAALISAAIAS